MLKYNVNALKMVTDRQRLVPVFYSIEDIGYENDYIVTIVHDGSVTFNNGDNVSVEHKILIDTETHIKKTEVVYFSNHVVDGVDANANMFSIKQLKKYELVIEDVSVNSDKDETYIVLTFNGNHFFSYGEECLLSTTYITNENVYNIDIKCEFVSEKSVKWVVDKHNDNEVGLANFISPNGVYYSVDPDETVVEYKTVTEMPERARLCDSEYILVLGNSEYGTTDKFYHKGIGSPNKNLNKFFRDSFLFGKSDFITLIVDSPAFQINIPIEQKFDTTINREILLNEKYTADAGYKTISKISGLEKDIYYPVIFDANTTNKPYLAKKIKFNLHFRKRDLSDGWTNPSDNEFWNGTNDSNAAHPVLSTNAYSNQDNHTQSIFVSDRSDLLSKIGFTDNDVKYQKSKLKKSFLRLSFFSSTNPADQLLLGYSTIFVNTGNLLSKFIKYSHSKDYYKPLDDNAQTQYIQNQALPISVEREPYYTSQITDDDEFESMRLSTQFVVSDRFSSDSSSEGFYIHLYKEYSSELPKDLYMAVDFNHAGYGKKIPMFLPTVLNTINASKHIKSYQEILNDWDNSGFYDFDEYKVYSYIHLKYRYDYDLKKHIYYLDNDYYGDCVLYDGENEITINLYEPKVKL